MLSHQLYFLKPPPCGLKDTHVVKRWYIGPALYRCIFWKVYVKKLLQMPKLYLENIAPKLSIELTNAPKNQWLLVPFSPLISNFLDSLGELSKIFVSAVEYNSAVHPRVTLNDPPSPRVEVYPRQYPIVGLVNTNLQWCQQGYIGTQYGIENFYSKGSLKINVWAWNRTKMEINAKCSSWGLRIVHEWHHRPWNQKILYYRYPISNKCTQPIWINNAGK